MAMSEDRTLRVERLLGVVNDAASAIGKRFASFLMVGAYVAVTVASTSDAMLVNGKVLNLPLLNVQVPLGLVGFYGVAPWLILIMHTDLLLQLSALRRKLQHFHRACDELTQDEQAGMRERLAGFYYVQFLAGDAPSKTLYALAGVVLWTGAVFFPLALLLGIQIRFLPFHSVGATWWHRLALIGDVLLVLAVWPQLSAEPGEPAVETAALSKSAYNRGRLAVGGLGGGMITASLLVATIPTAPVLLQSAGASVSADSTAVIAANAPDSDNWVGALSNWWFRVRNLELQNEVLTQGLEPKVVNVLRDGDAREKADVLASVSPLGFFQGRDLSHANFSNAVLPKFDFRALRTAYGPTFRTQLQGADFRWAQMQRVWLDEADAEGALFDGAQLQQASLTGVDTGTDLRQASLNDTQLQGAMLAKARFDGVRAIGAKLQGADLSGANLAGADFTGAQLQGAILRDTNLEGAKLDQAVLEGANLARAKLNGATFKGAHMKDALLAEAVIDANTDFSGAELVDPQDALSVSTQSGTPEDVFKTAKFDECDVAQRKTFRCERQIQSNQHVHNRLQHLLDLACGDAYVARGLVEQAHYSLVVQSRGESQSVLSTVLSTCLSKPSCKGIDLLDREVMEELQHDAQNAAKNSAPPATADTAMPALSCGPRTESTQMIANAGPNRH